MGPVSNAFSDTCMMYTCATMQASDTCSETTGRTTRERLSSILKLCKLTTFYVNVNANETM